MARAKRIVETHRHPVCVRHGRERKDVRIRHYFLCDECTERWTVGPFAGQRPDYEGEQLDGYCLLCNLERRVRLRSWFLCDICDRVAKSIGRNHVAERAIEQFWEREILPHHPTLRLKRNDVSELRRRDETATSGESEIDFLVCEGESPVLAIENKTGRSPIRGAGGMSQFQLDKSDCDCITYGMNQYGVGAYVIHAEVLENWKPPTWGFYCRSLWWSDVYRMREGYSSRKMRRDEGRIAIYFRKTAFDPIGSFRESLYDGEDLRLVKLYEQQGAIALYPDE